MDNRTGLEAQMAKHIHFIYIGRPPDNKDPNLILGCLDIIDVELLRSTGVTFHFWVIDEAERWKEVINNIGNYIDYDKYIMSHKNITALVNSIAVLPNDILDDLRRLDDGLIPEGAKRNIMKKDLSSIAVLKKYGGYYLDNNVFPNTSSSFLNFDEGVDFKAPADPRKLMKLYEYHSGAYGCFKTTVKRRFSMPRLDPPEEEPVEAYQIPTIECWAMYSTSDGQTINKIYNQYFYNLETLNNMLSEVKVEKRTDLLTSDLGLGRVIINSIASSIYQTQESIIRMNYIWDTDLIGTPPNIIPKFLRKKYGGSWR